MNAMNLFTRFGLKHSPNTHTAKPLMVGALCAMLLGACQPASTPTGQADTQNGSTVQRSNWYARCGLPPRARIVHLITPMPMAAWMGLMWTSPRRYVLSLKRNVKSKHKTGMALSLH
ncbi:hypothetical protein [Faucicola atlantae]|uniref:hypothetical protein n=1 Tax=Faucicola atlantae TaxID=34059 RepID=UPI003EC145D7